MRRPILSLIIFVFLSAIWFLGINFLMTNTIVAMLMIVFYALVVFFLHRRLLPLSGTNPGHAENLNNMRDSAIILTGAFMILAIFALLFPEIWDAWVFSKLYTITMILLVFTVLTWGNLYHEYVSYVFFGLVIISIGYGMHKSLEESKKVQETKNLELERRKEIQDSIVMIPINNDIDEIVVQQNQMEKYYGTFDAVVSKDTTVIFIPAYSILNIKIPYGTAIGIMDGNGYHYRYDGFIVTPLDGGRANFGNGDMYYRVYYPIKINVTFLVRKKTREEIRIAMPK